MPNLHRRTTRQQRCTANFSFLKVAGFQAPLSGWVWAPPDNRLRAAEPVQPQNGQQRVTLAYDYQGRRVWKQVETYSGTFPSGSYSVSQVRKFVWSGWLMLVELNGLSGDAVVRKYTWGLDLAGQAGASASGRSMLEGAGGIGGLLAVEQPQAGGNPLKYLYLYDANGNVGQVIDPAASSALASIKVKYEYDPYGRRTNPAMIGEYDQPFRFSTKYFDTETGLYYFGYRYYHPGLGRWISRDPIGEQGGANVRAFAANRPTDLVDSFGLKCCVDECEALTKECRIKVTIGAIAPGAETTIGKTVWGIEFANKVKNLAELGVGITAAAEKCVEPLMGAAPAVADQTYSWSLGDAFQKAVGNTFKLIEHRGPWRIWYHVDRRDCDPAPCHWYWWMTFWDFDTHYVWKDWKTVTDGSDGWEAAALGQDRTKPEGYPQWANGKQFFFASDITKETILAAAEEAASRFECGDRWEAHKE